MIDPELLADLRRLVNIMKLLEWQRDLIKTCPDDLMKSIVADNRSQPSSGGSMLPNATVSIVGAGKTVDPVLGPKYRPYVRPAEDDNATPADRSGWKEGTPLRPPPGINYVDALCDQAAAIDRAERIRQLAETAAVQRALKPTEPKAQEPKAPKDRGDKK
jgi:hypothetical protein